jgi:hypothetical protein
MRKEGSEALMCGLETGGWTVCNQMSSFGAIPSCCVKSAGQHGSGCSRNERASDPGCIRKPAVKAGITFNNTAMSHSFRLVKKADLVVDLRCSDRESVAPGRGLTLASPVAHTGAREADWRVEEVVFSNCIRSRLVWNPFNTRPHQIESDLSMRQRRYLF